MNELNKQELHAARVAAQVAFLTKVINSKGASPLTKKKAQDKLDHISKHGSLDN